MKIAGIQSTPVYLDPTRTMDKALALLGEASANGAELCAFPETFLSGYPVWPDITDGARWNDARQKEAYAAYIAGAVDANGPELAAITERSRELGVFVYLGLVERAESGGSVYCSLAAIDPENGLVSLHRKLMPTFHERMVWSQGDGAGLRVHPYRGIRVGGLNCWENWMPLARYAMYEQGEDLHVATWPGAPWLTEDITRFIALEGRVYSMAVGGVLHLRDVPESFPLRNEIAAQREQFLSGGTRIVGPDGKPVAEAPKNEETIIYADVDPATVRAERQNFDPAGHYARPDVFALAVNRARTTRPE